MQMVFLWYTCPIIGELAHTFKNVSHVVCQIPGVQGPQGPLGGAGLSVRKAAGYSDFITKPKARGPPETLSESKHVWPETKVTE